jgi:predicted O-methyltransferase YrrM
MADNILRRGLVADSTDSNPWLKKVKAQKGMTLEQNVYLDQFNKALVASERVDTFLMPMFDGLGLGRLIDWVEVL